MPPGLPRGKTVSMFDLDTFTADCLAANEEAQPRLAIKEVLTQAIADPDAVARALPATRAEIERIHVSDDLTIIKVVWGPGMRIFPHDHRMWAAIGIYGGREDNAFYRRSPEGVVGSGGTTLLERQVTLLGDDTIHAVHNPLDRYTGAIHIYGGDFFTQPRSQFDPDTLTEAPYDVEGTVALFEQANAAAER
jgi:predicted metal-dependent enzyme (double-stranded beta helix superfamily)